MPDIIKKFFDTFEIKPFEKPSRQYDSDGEICSYYVEYPEITDTHYLTMLAILTCCDDEQYDWRNLSELRKTILEDIIGRYEFETHMQNDYSMKEIIQKLFKGE